MTCSTPNLKILIAVFFLSLLMQPLAVLGTDRGEPRAKDRFSRLDRARAGDDPANLVFAEARGRMAAENEIRRVEFTSAGMKLHVKSVAGQDSRGSFEFRFKRAAIGHSVFGAEGTDGTEPVSQANEVFYARPGAVLEKYRATERGVEQTIVLDRNFAAGAGDLEITAEAATTLAWEEAPVRAFGALTFYSERGPALNFGPVVVTDTSGRQSEVETRLEGTRLSLVVDATWLRDATYPLAVQSSIQTLATPLRTAFGGPMRLGMKETTRVNATTVTSIEDTPVWRVQLRLETADVTEGGTSDRVEVKLNSNNSTWLYSNRGFKPRGFHTYDLNVDYVKKLRDIQMVQISKPGSDSWYIKSIALYVNGKAVYSIYHFYDLLYLGNNGIHFIMPHELRNDSLWRSYIVPVPPMSFSRAELEARIEGIVGDFLSDTLWTGWSPALKWEKYNHVVVWEAGPRRIQVKLGLRYYYDVDVNVSFDLEFSCLAGKIFLVTKNLHINYPIVDSASVTYKALLQLLLQPVLPMKIQSALQTVTYTNDLGQAACPTIEVLSDGTVSLSF